MAQPLDVNVVDTPFDVIATIAGIAGIIGLFIAIWALWVSKGQERDGEREAARERHLVFQLAILRDLVHVIDSKGTVYSPVAEALLAGFPSDRLKVARGWCKPGKAPTHDDIADVIAEIRDYIAELAHAPREKPKPWYKKLFPIRSKRNSTEGP